MKIIKRWYKTKPKDIVYVKKCRTCECVFTYNLDDIIITYDVDNFVRCPDCGYYISIFFKRKYKGDSNGTNK